jgi:hypothetical protein
MHTYRLGGEPGPAGPPAGLHSNTPPQSELGASRTFRLDLNCENRCRQTFGKDVGVLG